MKHLKIVGRCVTALKEKFFYRFCGYRIKPKLVVLEVTRRCNSRCKICATWKEKSHEEFTLSQLYLMFSDSLFKDVESVILTGGEPSLRKDLFELINIVYSCVPKASVWISTNGLLPDSVVDVVERCKKSNIPVGVGVSLDGVGDAHDRIRGVVGSFDSAVNLLGKLKKLEVPLTVGFTLSPLTAPNFLGLKQFCSHEEFPILVQKFDSSEFYNTKQKSRHITSDEWFIVSHLPEDLLNRYWLKPKRWRCYGLHSFLVVHVDGQVSAGLKCYNRTFGNMFTESPSTVWRRLWRGRLFVKNCENQCLNDWAFRQSMKTSYFPLLMFKLKTKLRQMIK